MRIRGSCFCPSDDHDRTLLDMEVAEATECDSARRQNNFMSAANQLLGEKLTRLEKLLQIDL
jgi:hypothetical protein